MEYSKEDLMEAKKQILGVGENMGTEESKKIWEENAQFSDDFNQIFPHLPVEYFLAIFWDEYDMICAIPFRSVYKELHADRETGC